MPVKLKSSDLRVIPVELLTLRVRVTVAPPLQNQPVEPYNVHRLGVHSGEPDAIRTVAIGDGGQRIAHLATGAAVDELVAQKPIRKAISCAVDAGGLRDGSGLRRHGRRSAQKSDAAGKQQASQPPDPYWRSGIHETPP
jgi:hypothetical protein